MVQQLADALRRDGDSSNTLIGIIILVLLLTYIGPDVLPQLVANTLPFLDEGIPCGLLRTGEERGSHQSLIGRAAIDPLRVRVEADPFPNDGISSWTIRVVVINNTIGTVPIVFNDNQVVVGDDGASTGFGLIFSPASSVSIDSNRDGIPNVRPQGISSFPEDDIHILGPRQRCVFRVTVPATQLNAIAQGQGDRTRVRAYYRINTAGIVQQGATVFQDQGLDVLEGGFIDSEELIIPFAATAAGS
jgi:hypothetical protein